MSTKNEFSKHANDYDDNNIIQRIVSKALVREIKNEAKNILELGCGSGQIYREIKWQVSKYDAMDFSNTMCALHPKNKNIDIKCLDFDSNEFYDYYKDNFYDLSEDNNNKQKNGRPKNTVNKDFTWANLVN